jgi:phage tail protein X
MSSPIAFNAPGGGPSSRAKLEHAYLQMHEPSSDGSLSNPGAQIGKIDFQFNPKELSLAKSAKWTRPSGRGNKKSGPPQYNGPQPSKLTLEMFFDASDTQDNSVVTRVEQLFSCCVPTDSSFQQNKGSPPWVLFRWGGLTGFLSYVSSVSVKYTLFTSSGTPVRATCSVTLEELSGDAPRQNPTSGGLVPRRVHVTVEGDTLAGIAYKEYGRAALWRAVAEANGIDDPMRIRPGTRLLLPSQSELSSGGRVATVEQNAQPATQNAAR